MIGEFAFTPSVFDEAANSDAELWREQLRELGNAMFPRTAAWPVMVANLYAGSWHRIAMETARAVQEDRARKLCQGILDNIGKTLVHRPVAGGDWPDDGGIAWGREALASHSAEPIDRIVCCRVVYTTLAGERQPVRCIDEVQAGGFWSEISNQWSQEMNIASQMAAIRKIALHADFLCLVTPHIRGMGNDETDFAVEMIRLALRRPAEFHSPEIEVHAEGPEKPASEDFAQRLTNVVSNTSKALRRALDIGQSVRLVLWPKLLDRYLIAGVYTETSGGKRLRSPRWGIAMSHIARRIDTCETKAPTSWSLVSRSQLGDLFDRFGTGAPSGMLHDAAITGCEVRHP